MTTTETVSGYTAEDLASPYFTRSGGYRSLPGFPHIWILADGREVWNAERGKPCSIWHDRAGYPRVWFAGRAWRVQRLVLAAWYPGCLDDGSHALHKVPKKDYVAVWNLYPDTAARNRADRVCHENNGRDGLCPRGHRKSGVNLVPSALKRGSHQCRSCARARSKANNLKRRHGIESTPEQVQAWSDEQFAMIVGNAVGILAFAVTATATAPHLMATA